MTNLPTWDQLMVPVLRVASDGQVRKLRALREDVAISEHLAPEQQGLMLPSGQPMAGNRIGWAASYLTRVGALVRPARGEYAITALGRELLAAHPGGMTEDILRGYAKPDDHWWTGHTGPREPSPAVTTETELDPIEQIEQGISRIHDEVAADLLSRLMANDPAFFEQAVIDLLVAMGYGGTNGRATRTALTNDAGIDGIIDQDTLGLNRVYVQAKRYGPGNRVQRPELQGFVGALSGKADGGVFITTSQFSAGARAYAEAVPTRIILIDGARLASLMIRHGVGVQVKQTVQIVEIDEDFFE